MSDELDRDAESRKNRNAPGARARTPRVTRSTRHSKKPVSGFGGSHQRRNKHWNW